MLGFCLGWGLLAYAINIYSSLYNVLVFYAVSTFFCSGFSFGHVRRSCCELHEVKLGSTTAAVDSLSYCYIPRQLRRTSSSRCE